VKVAKGSNGKPMSSTPSDRTKVFISYSHKDVRYLRQLQTHLAYFERVGLIDVWDDTKLLPGAVWHEEIEKAIQQTKVAILLVSAAFLASRFIAENELPPLLAAAQTEGAIIVPVILSACAFEETELVQFQAVNSPSMPVAKMKGFQRDELWAKVARDIKEAILPQLEAKPLVPSSSLLPSGSIGEEEVIERVKVEEAQIDEISRARKYYLDQLMFSMLSFLNTWKSLPREENMVTHPDYLPSVRSTAARITIDLNDILSRARVKNFLDEELAKKTQDIMAELQILEAKPLYLDGGSSLKEFNNLADAIASNMENHLEEIRVRLLRL